MGATANPPLDRVAERRRAVALAQHYREAEGMSIAQIAERLGRAPATIKGYLYDPTNEKARAVKARDLGGVPRLRRLHPACATARATPTRMGERADLLAGALDHRVGQLLETWLTGTG
jgi:predicted transcriptional regulator